MLTNMYIYMVFIFMKTTTQEIGALMILSWPPALKHPIREYYLIDIIYSWLNSKDLENQRTK